MTGRAAGYCAGYPVPGYMNPGPRGGYGFWGRGGGRGRRNWYYATGLPGWARSAQGLPAFGGVAPGRGRAPYAAPYAAPPGVGPTPEQELEALKGQAEYLEDALGDIRRRIEELEQEGS
jgi:hypothetical protein